VAPRRQQIVLRINAIGQIRYRHHEHVQPQPGYQSGMARRRKLAMVEPRHTVAKTGP
jgi:hypothetical protein